MTIPCLQQTNTVMNGVKKACFEVSVYSLFASVRKANTIVEKIFSIWVFQRFNNYMPNLFSHRKTWNPGKDICQNLQRKWSIPQGHSRGVHVLTNEAVFRSKFFVIQRNNTAFVDFISQIHVNQT